jgi:hypothetical protein
MARARAATQITLGELIGMLVKCSKEKPVVIRMGNTDMDEDYTAGDLDSYRGRSEQLAIEPVYCGYHTTGKKVAALLASLQEAVGRSYYGYKGGDNLMDEGSFMRAANYGNNGPAIVDVEEKQDRIIIFTDAKID